MSSEGSLFYFLLLVVVFVGSMLLLLLSKSLVVLLLAWDFLGLSRVFLVGFFLNLKSLTRRVSTFVAARVGDSFLLFGLFSLFYCGFLGYFFFGCVLCIFLAASTKRALVPFSSWLPKAMAAPTPVRALVHSSTLVVAGFALASLVFRRSFFCFALFSLGLLTFFLGVLSNVVEVDLKKVVALSTLMHMGLLFLFLGAGFLVLSWVHVFLHAFFKRALFLLVGAGMHFSFSSQDSRGFSPFFRGSSFWLVLLFVVLFSLNGLFFVGGFFSKEVFVSSFGSFCGWSLLVVVFSVGVFYSLKLLQALFVASRSGGLSFSVMRLLPRLALVVLTLFRSSSASLSLNFLSGEQFWWVFFLLLAVFVFLCEVLCLPHFYFFWMLGLDILSLLVAVGCFLWGLFVEGFVASGLSSLRRVFSGVSFWLMSPWALLFSFFMLFLFFLV